MRIIIKPLGAIVLLSGITGLVIVACMRRPVTMVSSGTAIAAVPSVPAVAAAPSSTPALERIDKNGSMDVQRSADNNADFGRTPEGWNDNWVGRGRIHAFRDTSVFHSAPASLRIESVGGNGEGQVHQIIPAQAGDKIRVEAYLKTEGRAKVQVAVQPYGPGGQPLSFMPVIFREGTSEWTKVNGDPVTLPAQSNSFGLALYLSGDGKAWLDDVQVTRVP